MTTPLPVASGATKDENAATLSVALSLRAQRNNLTGQWGLLRGLAPRNDVRTVAFWKGVLKGQRGFTLAEAIVALGISGFMVTILGMSLFLLSQTPAQMSDQLTSLEDLRVAARWISRDGSLAQAFTAGSSPSYGYFSWTDYTEPVSVTRSVTYTLSGNQLLRQEYVGASLVYTQAVARNIASYSDVVFQYVAPQFVFSATTGLWSFAGGLITATLTSTVRFTGNPSDQVVSTTVAALLRAQSERAVNAPGPTPTPPPLPGEIIYYCASLNLLQGTYQSGGCAQLALDDTAYYVVRSSTGNPKFVTWEITSQVITLTSISAIDVTFVGQSDNAGVLQQLFVYNPTDPAHTDGGYNPAIADQAFTYTENNVDKSTTFPLDDVDVTYVNSLGTKTVKIKAIASANNNFNLSADQFIFRVR